MAIVFALADDITGALEVGAKFAGCGVPSRVATSNAAVRDLVTVIDTETRHLPPGEASRIVSALVPPDAKIIYLKTDSTLRGNIAAEMRGLLNALPNSRIAYIPAYPALRRTVEGGCLFVDGIPVDRTPFANDPLNPIRDASIKRLLGNDIPFTLYDGQTDADVAAAVAAALAAGRNRIVAGPASVAGELALQLDFPRRPVENCPTIMSCLIVNGSLHPVSARQIAYAQSHGCASSEAVAEWNIFQPDLPAGLSPLEIARETGRGVCRFLQLHAIDALMVFGGDTAFAILQPLGCPSLEPIREVMTGIPLSRLPDRPLYLITKAGGFGDETLICRLKQILHGTSTH